ncbi:MAG: SpoIIE family protein phosphatase [Anaerolineales bacterium]|nr:SpoIIE family protein phosphatase [Anaerolineales bacterium]
MMSKDSSPKSDYKVDLQYIADLCSGLTTIPSDPEEICEGLYLSCAQFLNIDIFLAGRYSQKRFSSLLWICEGQKQPPFETVFPAGCYSFLDRLLETRVPQLFDSTKDDRLPEKLQNAVPADRELYGIVFPLFNGDRLWGTVAVFSFSRPATWEPIISIFSLLTTSASGQLAGAFSLQENQTLAFDKQIKRTLVQILTSNSPMTDRLCWALDFTAEMLPSMELCLHQVQDQQTSPLAATPGFTNSTGLDTYNPELAHLTAAVRKIKVHPASGDPIQQLCIPISSAGGLTGILEIRQPSPTGIKKGEKALLTELAGLFSFPLYESSLQTRTEKQEWTTTVLSEVAKNAARPGETADALHAVLQLLILLAGVDWAALYIIDNSGMAVPGPVAGLEKQIRTIYEESSWKLDVSDLSDTVDSGRIFLFHLPPGLTPIFNTRRTYAIAFREDETPLGILLIPAVENLMERSALFEGIGHQIQLRLSNARLIEKTASQREMERELLLARKIQESFLPDQTPSVAGWDISCSWQAARQVGGDFYDFLQPPNIERNANSFDFIIADVSGKGVPAALYMALSRTLLRYVAATYSDPGIILTRVNRFLIANTNVDHFISMFYGCWDLEQNILHYANAGHNPPILASPSGQCKILDHHEMVLGIEESIIYTSHSIQIPPGYLLMAYTDGITEAEASPGTFYGINRLQQVCKTMNQCTSSDIIQKIRSDVDEFSNGHLSDDRTLIVLHRLVNENAAVKPN